MSTEWSSFWLDVHNLRWAAVDQVILERVANVLGWGPDRTLLELGAGRGLHSKLLHETMRSGPPHTYDPCPEAFEYMRRAGLHAIKDEAELAHEYDIVWSNGLIEHFEGEERQEVVDRHLRLSRDWVLFVVPRANWQRKIFRPREGVPHQTEYTEAELRERMLAAARSVWGCEPPAVSVRSFCPLFGVRHIPDAWYPVIDRLLGWALPDGLLIGWMRKGGGAG
jgi:hypothetical protein